MHKLFGAEPIPVPSVQPRPNPQAGRILIIEDDPQFQAYVRSLLARKGYELDATNTGRDGLQRVLGTKPDLLILDLQLPDINGIEVCRLLRAAENTRRLPVLVMTARDDAGGVLASAAAAVGANGFLVKNFGENELLSQVRRLLVPRKNIAARVLARGRVLVDIETQRVWIAGSQKTIGPQRFELLCILLRRLEGVSCEELVGQGWDPATVRKTIQRLKHDLGLKDAIVCCRKAYKFLG